MKRLGVLRRIAGTGLVAGLAALAAACGSQAAGGAAPGGAPATTRPKSSLTISVVAARGATPRRWTLTCEPAGGTHPDPAAACRVLQRAGDWFAPVPPGIMCPMIASGPQTASITGTWRGKRISAAYAKDNGCQTTRWDRIAQVLSVNPGGPMIPAQRSPG